MTNFPVSAPSIDFRVLFAVAPTPVLVVAPDPPRFTITDVNDAYLAATMRTRDDLIGRALFEAMPDNPDDPRATGVTNLRASLERAIAARRPDKMPVQKYDIPRPGGGFEERWWDPINAPVIDERGEVTALIHHVVDVSERERAEAEVRSHAARQAFRLELEEGLRDLAEPVPMMAEATALLGRHLGVAQVGFAEVEDNQEHIVVARDWNEGRIPSVVGRWRMNDFGPAFIREMKTGETVAIPDVAQDPRTRLPEIVAAYDGINTRAILDVPLVKHGRMVAMLFVHHPEPRAWAPDEVALVEETCERLWSAVERARAEARLRESEARYRTLFGAVDVGFCVVDMKFDAAGRAVDYRLAEINPAFERQTGLHGAAGKWASEVAPGLERHWFDTYGRVALTGEAVRFENFAEPFGRWYDVHALCAGGPEQHRVAILFNDITPRKTAEDRLRELNETLERRVAERTAELSESQRRFQGIFDSAFQFMALLAPDGTVVEVNRTALAWSQIRPSDIVGKPFWLAAPMRDNPALQAAVESSIRRAAAGETVRAEHEMRGAGEVRATVDFSLKPVPGERGEPVWLVAEGRDITELKAAQDALRQSQKLESMGQLTGGVAHDLNNLLTPIMGSLDLLQRRGLGGEREQRLIAGALQSTERAKMLVQRLLAFARRQPLQPTPVDVRGLVEGMADLVASTSGPQIKVAVEVAPDLPSALADPNQLEMAILNLSVNARDAMPDGGRLTIVAHPEDVSGKHRSGLAAGRYVRLSVADTGSGMDETTLKRAVEPFFSTKGVGKGTGLGLSMVHGLAAQLGGALAIHSKPGLGTNVELWLPTTEESAEQAGRAEGTEAPATSGTALLVDDEDVVRASTADMLTELGYAVVDAGSAEEALRLLDCGLAPSLVVTDHLMPGMSGTEFAREVRRRLPSTRALVISGYAEVEGVAPDLPRLVKPFRQADLAASLAALAEEHN